MVISCQTTVKDLRVLLWCHEQIAHCSFKIISTCDISGCDPVICDWSCIWVEIAIESNSAWLSILDNPAQIPRRHIVGSSRKIGCQVRQKRIPVRVPLQLTLDV